MGEALAILQLIQALSAQIGKASALIRKMREEGRDELTADELSALQFADDAARADLVAAIERARAEGR